MAMTLTGTSTRYELIANADLTSANVTGSAQIGTPSTAVVYADIPTIAYSVVMDITDGDTLTLDLSDGAITGEVAGTSQVETATIVAASGATSSGTLTLTLTAAGMTGSPLAVPVALLTGIHTSAAQIANACRGILGTLTDVTSLFSISGAGAEIILTRIEKAADDATLNLAIPAALGVTAAPSSANTTAGVRSSLAYRIDGKAWDQTDYQGNDIATATKLHAVLIKSETTSTGRVVAANADDEKIVEIEPGGIDFSIDPNGTHIWSTKEVIFNAAAGNTLITIDIQAG